MVPGKLIDLETETDDPYWSVNIKRGLLSFMQLDLMEEERVRVDSDELRILNKLNIATPPNRSPNKAYRVMEVSSFSLFSRTVKQQNSMIRAKQVDSKNE